MKKREHSSPAYELLKEKQAKESAPPTSPTHPVEDLFKRSVRHQLGRGIPKDSPLLKR